MRVKSTANCVQVPPKVILMEMSEKVLIEVTIQLIGKNGEEEMKDRKERDVPSKPGQTKLTNVHFIICLCITYAFKLELLQGLGELLDGS